MWLYWCIDTCGWSYISEINNTQIDNVNDFDVVMPFYNLIGYSDN